MKSEELAAHTDLLTYVLQDYVHNRLTPRVVDIAYTAFGIAKRQNDDDGGPTDWFNDTKPIVMKAIDKLRKDLMEDRVKQSEQGIEPVNNEQRRTRFESGCGMTLRDAMALSVSMPDDFSPNWAAALVGSPSPGLGAASLEQIDWWARAEAIYRYRIADAMLKARETK